MSSGIQKADMQRQVSVKFFTMVRKHVKSMSEEISIFITVPAPGSIGIRIVTFTGTEIDTFFRHSHRPYDHKGMNVYVHRCRLQTE